MGAMSHEQGRGTAGDVIKDSITGRIFASILGKQRTPERASSFTSAAPPIQEIRKEVTREVTREVTKEVTKEVTEEVTKEVTGDVSLRKLRQVYSRAVKAKVSSQQYLDVSGSDSESDDELGPEGSSESQDSEGFCSDVGDWFEVADGKKQQQLVQDTAKYVCKECGISVKKPAILIQHMRTHSSQKSFACPHDGCNCAYKRKDHLNRHLKKHQGVVFICPEAGCDQTFTMSANLQRHLKHHAEKERVQSSKEKNYSCLRPDCGKSFRYPSMLRYHEEKVHEKLEHYDELYCMYPGCGDEFESEKALLEHAETSHPYLLCEVCGETIRRKSFFRHARTHATKKPRDVVCPYDGCSNTYTRESNLQQHVRSVHLQLKPFVCSHDGCHKKYAHKAAKDRHELSTTHVSPSIDFHVEDKPKPRGGRKPIAFDKVETFLRKRRVDELSR